MLERILYLFNSGKDYNVGLNELRNYHVDIVTGLFEDPAPVIREIELHFTDVQEQLSAARSFDEMYDQVVSKGELVSSIIVHRYLISENIPSHWHDARDSIRTDNNFREGRVDWSELQLPVNPLDDPPRQIVITQVSSESRGGLTTTLGREGLISRQQYLPLASTLSRW